MSNTIAAWHQIFHLKNNFKMDHVRFPIWLHSLCLLLFMALVLQCLVAHKKWSALCLNCTSTFFLFFQLCLAAAKNNSCSHTAMSVHPSIQVSVPFAQFSYPLPRQLANMTISDVIGSPHKVIT